MGVDAEYQALVLINRMVPLEHLTQDKKAKALRPLLITSHLPLQNKRTSSKPFPFSHLQTTRINQSETLHHGGPSISKHQGHDGDLHPQQQAERLLAGHAQDAG